MPNEKTKFRIFLSAAEPSGDAHCAGLITALKACPELLERGKLCRTGHAWWLCGYESIAQNEVNSGIGPAH